MKLDFNNMTLVVVPETGMEAMALRYWYDSYQSDPDGMLQVSTKVEGSASNPGHGDETDED